ncbi:MAG: hypothetical protein MHM6MM_000940 [Cercozoa sp. M6MM]
MGRSQSSQLGTPVVLHVYDLTPANDWMYPIGLGAYHSGVAINGREYCYGGSPGSGSTGVGSHTPLDPPGSDTAYVRFRAAIDIGRTLFDQRGIDAVIDELSREFIAGDYNVLRQNCNSFSDALCRRLVDRGIPRYVNRAAWWGQCCECCIPESEQQQQQQQPQRPQFIAFTGEGHRLNSNDNNSKTSSSGNTDALERRRLIAEATERRLRQQQQQQQHDAHAPATIALD